MHVANKKSPLIKILLAIVALVVLCAFGYRVLRYFELRGAGGGSSSEQSPGYEHEDGRPTVMLDGQWYAKRENVESFLLIGLDKFQQQIDQTDTFRNTQQSDFLLLLTVDHSAKTCTALQINRDTMVQIHELGLRGEEVGTFTGQLALAHTYGSGGIDSATNTALSVSELLYGTKIDHVISATMDAVSMLTDSIGGVTVTVLDDFSQIDPTLKQGEKVVLSGEQALTYVRTRQGLEDSSNLARLERQRQFLVALYESFGVYAENSKNHLADLIVQLSPYTISDCSAQQLYELMGFMSDYTLNEIVTIDGEAKMGEEFMEFYPDENALTHCLIDLLYEPIEE